MIIDLTAAQAIEKFYKERSVPIHERFPSWEKDRLLIQQEDSERFIMTVREMSRMLEYVGWDGDQAYRSWITIFEALMDMCAYANVEPRTAFPEKYAGADYKTYPLHWRQHMIIQYMNRFIDARVLKLEPLWWIELGNEIGLTDIKL